MLSKFGKFNGNKTIVNCANFSLTGCFLKLDSYESPMNLVILLHLANLVKISGESGEDKTWSHYP